MTHRIMNSVIDTLICMDKANKDLAKAYAETLKITYCEMEYSHRLSGKAFVESLMAKTEKNFVLFMDESGLHLQMMHPSILKIKVDFLSPQMEYRRAGGSRNELIGKAVGFKSKQSPVVFDATAGLGKDAFVLASLGCTVYMLERNPWVHVLLEDGLTRANYTAEENSELELILRRLKLFSGEAKDFFQSQVMDAVDCIYLDPMFPHPEKRALVKKEMQLLQNLVGEDPDSKDLLNGALSTKVRRVVVKRPRNDEAIASNQISYTLEGKRNRYDIYLQSGES